VRLFIAVVLALLATRAAAAPAEPCASASFEGSRFTVCRYDPAKHQLRLAVTDSRGKALRNFAGLSRALGGDAARVRFAMNAGMFGTDSMPIGLYIENGVRRRGINRVRSAYGNFYMQPNGVFVVGTDGRAQVIETDDFARRSPAPKWATQSGPMLVINGKLNPGFSADGPSRNIRNGVGELDGGTAAFVISEQPVSFGRFARFFRDALKSPNALYLDGAVSSIWVPALRRRDSAYDLGPLIVVLDKNR
jgi:uncharacterized protein YigE (DUF2233 family)